MTKTKRTTEEKLVGAAGNPVTINGKEVTAKRLKVREINELIQEKMNRTKKAQASQVMLGKIQQAVESQDYSKIGIDENNIDAEIEKLQNNVSEIVLEASGTHNLWLIERCYDVSKEDLDELEYDEYEAAVEGIFEVNPSLGKMKALLTMNPFQTNQNG